MTDVPAWVTPDSLRLLADACVHAGIRALERPPGSEREVAYAEFMLLFTKLNRWARELE